MSGGGVLIGSGKIVAISVGAVRLVEIGKGWRTAEDRNMTRPSRVRVRVAVDGFFLTALCIGVRRG